MTRQTLLTAKQQALRSRGLAVHFLTAELVRRGVSAAGVSQVLAGEVVAGLGDRLLLARIVGAAAGRAHTVGINESITVGAARTETVGHNETITVHGGRTENALQGLSALGAQQLTSGQPVTDPRDRQVFAVWLTVGFFG
jgi:hypothetical protein